MKRTSSLLKSPYLGLSLAIATVLGAAVSLSEFQYVSQSQEQASKPPQVPPSVISTEPKLLVAAEDAHASIEFAASIPTSQVAMVPPEESAMRTEAIQLLQEAISLHLPKQGIQHPYSRALTMEEISWEPRLTQVEHGPEGTKLHFAVIKKTENTSSPTAQHLQVQRKEITGYFDSKTHQLYLADGANGYLKASGANWKQAADQADAVRIRIGPAGA
jgi:hypothetical protein